ncbi:hypothetical protein ACWENR_02645 [Micromonospora sp. NPDC004336]
MGVAGLRPAVEARVGAPIVVALGPLALAAWGLPVLGGVVPAVAAGFGPGAVVAVRPLVSRGAARVLARLGEPARLGTGGGGDGAVPPGRLVPERAGVVAVVAGVVARAGGVDGAARAGPAGAVVAVPRVAVRRLLPVGRLPVVGPGRLRVAAVRLVVAPPAVGAVLPAVPAVLPTGPALGLVVPGAAEVGAVGPGRGERGHLGAADDRRPSPGRGRRGVLDADVARVALARELRLPLGGRLDHPGRLGGVVPPVGVAAHPKDLSPRRVSGTAAAHRR